MGLTDTICTAVSALRPEDLPPATLTAAKHVLLDATGVMLGASGMAPEVRPFLNVARAAGPGPCAILGTGQSAAPGMAALANGAMAHALDYEDAFDRKPGHPNASLVPALLALAQADGPKDGPSFLTALAIGCDISCRLALALRQDIELGGWYPPPILAGLGAAVGAAKLLGLDARGIRDALSLALCQMTMPGEIKHSESTVIRAVREAFPAQAAVLSAQLARERVAGFEAPLEGRDGFYALYADGQYDPSDLTEGLGQRFWIETLTFKAWPSCRGTHPFIELALDLRTKYGFDPIDVAAITVSFDDIQQMLIDPLERKVAPQTLIDAKFSIPFCIALALVSGRVDLDSFVPEALGDAGVLALAKLVTGQPQTARDWQRGSGGALQIALKDGRLLTCETADALGCPARPLSEEGLVAKFVDCAGRAAKPLGKSAALGLAADVLALERCGDVGALFV